MKISNSSRILVTLSGVEGFSTPLRVIHFIKPLFNFFHPHKFLHHARTLLPMPSLLSGDFYVA
ncbi:hypothetical protein Aoki45_27730 [Algoriphagus sp. oki45]|nr:hypothetical protein Aoki45_27730 [Algoriphagus sp. oki45]